MWTNILTYEFDILLVDVIVSPLTGLYIGLLFDAGVPNFVLHPCL